MRGDIKSTKKYVGVHCRIVTDSHTDIPAISKSGRKYFKCEKSTDMKKRAILTTLFILFFCLTTFGQTEKTPFSNLANEAYVSLMASNLLFHSHPIGQPPYIGDAKTASEGGHYIFSMKDKQVYIYDKKGVLASMPMENFVTPKE